MSIVYDTHVLIGRERREKDRRQWRWRARRKKKVESTQEIYSDIIYTPEQNNARPERRYIFGDIHRKRNLASLAEWMTEQDSNWTCTAIYWILVDAGYWRT